MAILNGRKLADKIINNVRQEIQARNLKLGLAVVLVGTDPISKVFIAQKEKAAAKAGIGFRSFHFPEETEEQKLKEYIKDIAQDPDNSGVVIQLPLPKSLENTQEILNIVPLEKDVDVLSESMIGKFYTGKSKILPPVVSAISHFFKKYRIYLKGKNIVIMGAGRLVGKPVSVWLENQKGNVTILNESVKNPEFFTKKADIIISGVGKPNLLRGNMVKTGVVVIDAGTAVFTGKIQGDADFKSVSKRAGYLTPVPGGVGPMTVACLIENLLKLNS